MHFAENENFDELSGTSKVLCPNSDSETLLAAGTALRLEIEKACDEFTRALVKENKEYFKQLHTDAKKDSKAWSHAKAHALYLKHEPNFKNGSEIDIRKIEPVLRMANEDETSELFYVARSFWSMPYNKGYGRRLRFVVYDAHHEAVIGIIGLQSPPADLSVRDKLFSYPKGKKLELVNSTLDAYAVGALPPYSRILGGKLCAGLVASNQVRDSYWSCYAGKKSVMSGEDIQKPLTAVTTTSAFGRSSQYNRLKYNNRLLAEPLGYTMGYGTLHVEHLYGQLCDYLKLVGLYRAGGFGNGPKVRWQNITRALISVGLSDNMLRHGLKREVFLYRHIHDLETWMSGGKLGEAIQMSVSDFSSFWRSRWAIPRGNSVLNWNLMDDRTIIKTVLQPIGKIPQG